MRELIPEDHEAFEKTYEDRPYFALRINTAKISESEFEKIAPYPAKKIPFTEGGYYISDTDAWSKHPYYYAGLYYIQEPSAMLPAELIPVSEGDLVLDLCAAPGGKSTRLIQKRPKLLVSNDISFSRTIPLVKNMELCGCTNYCVTCADPEKLSQHFSGCFDRIIVDAPCSGEGMFRKDPGLIRSYEEKGPGYYRDIQESILASAYKMLKSGGFLMYSTCTFSDIEDEQTLIAFLSAHKDMRVCEIEPKYGLCGPYDRYKDHNEIKGCVHALPHRFAGEGHFVALMKKEGQMSHEDARGLHHEAGVFVCFDDLPDIVRRFLDYLRPDSLKTLKESRFLIGPDNMIYLLPECFLRIYSGSIRFVRTGVCIGSIKRSGNFVPHTAFALSLKPDDIKQTVSFEPDDMNVYRYLKGETIVPDTTDTSFPESGYVLVCVARFPLGFAVSDGKKLKNLYEKGWIYR